MEENRFIHALMECTYSHQNRVFVTWFCMGLDFGKYGSTCPGGVYRKDMYVCVIGP